MYVNLEVYRSLVLSFKDMDQSFEGRMENQRINHNPL